MSDEIKQIAALIGHQQVQEKRVAAIQRMEAVWEQKAPLANISPCDGKPCVQVTGNEYTNKKGDRFYIIEAGRE